MQLRISTIRRNNKVYRYAQLVESCRDARGRPTKRVLRHLGTLPEPVVRALKKALKAEREGQALLTASEVAALLDGQDVANRRYLDLAVLSDCWHFWKLDSTVDHLLPSADNSPSFPQVVLSLALQRCCAPNSKLEATRWVPRTALPELLRFNPDAFNNSRVHRALDLLHQISTPLQEQLARAYQHKSTSRALFMDVTDTYFEGIGCPMAELTRTKTKMPNKRCIAIILLVNDLGYPMRWSVVGGKTKDWTAMSGLLSDLGHPEWLQNTPVVFDRAMGNRSTVTQLKERGLWFLTAAHVNSIESWTSEIPGNTFDHVPLGLTDDSYEADIERVAEAARQAGFGEIHEHLFAIDLGVRSPLYDDQLKPKRPAGKRRRMTSNGLANHLERARQMRQRFEADPNLTHKTVAQSFGVSRGRAGQLLALLRLNPEVQEQIGAQGERFPLSEKDIQPLLKLGPAEQLAALQAMLSSCPAPQQKPQNEPEPIGPLRFVAYFNPRLFVDIRRRTAGHLVSIQARVDELNHELAHAKRSRKMAPTFRKFSQEIERLDYLDTFDIQLEPISVQSPKGAPIHSFRGDLSLLEDVWAKRRKFNGFVLLVGHPQLPQTATELVQLYRDKDVVEKDFQSIKSLIRLRPVWHYKDSKVQAHVTICMLALLLRRTLRTRLEEAELHMSSQMVLDLLKDCRLNERDDTGVSMYHLTKRNADQEQILKALDLFHLVDPSYVGPRLMART